MKALCSPMLMLNMNLYLINFANGILGNLSLLDKNSLSLNIEAHLILGSTCNNYVFVFHSAPSKLHYKMNVY